MYNEEEKRKILFNTWMGFNSNIGALYTFFEKVTEIADAVDKEQIKKIAFKLAPLVKDTPENIEKDISKFYPSIDDLDIYPDIRNEASVKEMMELFQDSKFIEDVREWQLKKPFKSQKFIEIIYSAFIDPPMNGLLLRKSMLVTLITYLEMLIERLLKNHFEATTEKRTGSEDNLEGQESGWGKRLARLEKIGIHPKALQKYKNEIIEITKRRNLLVHNDGVVTEKYVKDAPQKYKNLKPGNVLIVSTKYFQRAIDIIYTLGFLLCISSWSLEALSENTQINKIDEFLIPTLKARRYNLILEITNNLNDLPFSQPAIQRMKVDRAIAFRETGNINEVKKIILNLKNSEHNWYIDLAISCLSNDTKKLQKQLLDKRLASSNSHWPLFDPFRNEIWFKRTFMSKNKRTIPKARKSH